MHELTITQGILSIVLQKAREIQAKKITRVEIQLGKLTGYVPECIQLQFAILSKGTAASGAHLIFSQLSTRLYCRKCQKDYSSDSFDLACPECYTLEMDILSGQELYVESMEAE